MKTCTMFYGYGRKHCVYGVKKPERIGVRVAMNSGKTVRELIRGKSNKEKENAADRSLVY